MGYNWQHPDSANFVLCRTDRLSLPLPCDPRYVCDMPDPLGGVRHAVDGNGYN